MSWATGVNLGAAMGLGCGGLCLSLGEFRVCPRQSTSSGGRVWWIARGGRGRTGAPSETSRPRLCKPHLDAQIHPRRVRPSRRSKQKRASTRVSRAPSRACAPCLRLREDEQAVARASRTADWRPTFRLLMDARFAMSVSRASKRCLAEPTSRRVRPGTSPFRTQCVRWRAPNVLSQSPILRVQTESSFWDHASIPILGPVADLFERQEAGGVYARVSCTVAVAHIGATARVVAVAGHFIVVLSLL